MSVLRAPPVARCRSALTTAAWITVLVAAVACIAGTIAAAALGGSVLVVRTGSMAPGLPVGAAVLTRPVPAASARRAEVLAVRRPDGRVVIHRVVSVGPVAGAPALRSLVLRGDANPADDAPVVVSSAQRPVLVIAASWPGRAASVLQARWTQFWLGAASGGLATAEWFRAGRRRRTVVPDRAAPARRQPEQSR